MKTVEITFKTKIPVDAADNEIREWAEYNLGDRGGCSSLNPLVEYGLEGFDVDVSDA